ncbi:Bgt-50353 [Blumeria graminis f. sp. tritici]|uniref:Bgt-50353 n=1 Tax=Blumeria graminis f. sp. tritici TaxID=62690 RepID=A0A9X9LAG6_BLUGR|nr:Bgt-50353 [Blumeria graminis f. sp. tritici]
MDNPQQISQEVIVTQTKYLRSNIILSYSQLPWSLEGRPAIRRGTNQP